MHSAAPHLSSPSALAVLLVAAAALGCSETTTTESGTADVADSIDAGTDASPPDAVTIGVDSGPADTATDTGSDDTTPEPDAEPDADPDTATPPDAPPPSDVGGPDVGPATSTVCDDLPRVADPWVPATGDFVMTDTATNSLWNVRGQAFAGPCAGVQLAQLPSHNAFWFSWSISRQGGEIWNRSPNDNDPIEADSTGTCDVPCDEIRSGGPPPDGIPALDVDGRWGRPQPAEMVGAFDDGAAYLANSDLVLGVYLDGEARAYPHGILWWHEIQVDRIGDREINATFCPLTGSGTIIDGVQGGQPWQAYVSGRLFNSNLTMFERDAEDPTFWNQMLLRAVSGPRKGESLTTLPVTETTWGRWREMHPDTLVTSDDTGYERNYSRYPYGDYREDHTDTFMQTNPEPVATYQGKELVMSLQGPTNSKAYAFVEMQQFGERLAINDAFDGMNVAVVYEAEFQFAVPFDRTLPGGVLEFSRHRGALTRLLHPSAMAPVATLILVAALILSASPAHAISGFAPAAQSVWLEIGYSYWFADEQYAGPFGQGELGYDSGREIGDRIPISIDEDGGSFKATSIFASFRITPVERFSVGAFMPIQQTSTLDLATVDTTTVGTGDLFLFMAYQLTPPELTRVGSSLFLHAKFPLTQTTFETLSVPLSEGQVDLAVEQQTTFVPHPRIHLSGRLLWRYRFPVEQRVGGTTVLLKPGNEAELGAEIGASVHAALWVRATYSGLFAGTSEDRTINEFIAAKERRQIHNAELGLYFNFGHWLPAPVSGLAVDAWVRQPIGGVDYLRGTMLGGGLAYSTGW